VKLLSEGRASYVYDLGDGRVLRQFKGHGDAAREELVMVHARSHGFPVPRVLERRADGLVLERIDGPTMAQDLSIAPWRLRQHARTIAGLHEQLHEIRAPDGLRAIEDGDTLLHLDLHPENVLLSATGPVVIDWSNSLRGTPELDIAFTWMILKTSSASNPFELAGMRLFARVFAGFAGPSRIEAGLQRAVEIRLDDPNIYARERTRLHRLAER
jgi:aminoglycoside phosphotransferase (APT) family kinase protein